jgi:hypothetical protein
MRSVIQYKNPEKTKGLTYKSRCEISLDLLYSSFVVKLSSYYNIFFLLTKINKV